MYESVEGKEGTPPVEWTSDPAGIVMEERPEDDQPSTERRTGAIALGRGFDSAARGPKPDEKDLPSFGDMNPAEGDPKHIIRSAN